MKFWRFILKPQSL